MDEHFFDDLAKGLDDGTVSRGRALKLVGAALLSSALMPLVARPAEASLKRKCHRKGGSLCVPWRLPLRVAMRGGHHAVHVPKQSELHVL